MQARTSVVPKAAVEEAKSLSTNGSTSQTTGLDFDELTDLIKCVFLFLIQILACLSISVG